MHPAELVTIAAKQPLINLHKLQTLPDFEWGIINFHIRSTTKPPVPHARRVETTALPTAGPSPNFLGKWKKA